MLWHPVLRSRCDFCLSRTFFFFSWMCVGWSAGCLSWPGACSGFSWTSLKSLHLLSSGRSCWTEHHAASCCWTSAHTADWGYVPRGVAESCAGPPPVRRKGKSVICTVSAIMHKFIMLKIHRVPDVLRKRIVGFFVRENDTSVLVICQYNTVD